MVATLTGANHTETELIENGLANDANFLTRSEAESATAALLDGASYERWIWIELIGFDNTLPDFGVKEYLDRAGYIPRAMSFLLTSPDLIHHHEGLDVVQDLPPDICSYWGHLRNAERERQVWTNHQLRQLIETLQSHGIKVFAATFTSFLNNGFHQEWLSDYPELFEKRRNGELHTVVLPLKRFKDGSYYEDFMIPKLCTMLQDYNFDGWHAADGWGPARAPLYYGDFSDDIFEQFVRAQDIAVPDSISFSCDDDPGACTVRADWIWNNHRRQWMDFYGDRWGSFYVKKVAALHAIGKEVVINSAWTRDPLEALYRYGIDYRKIVASGIDGIVTESAAGASDMESMEGGRVYLYNYVATLMLMQAYVPKAKLIFLHGIKDTKEQWDLIHHAPTVLESETYSLTNVFLRDDKGKLKRCADGFVICLGDAIAREDWQWLEQRWAVAFTETPKRLLGATLVWSDEAHSNEIDEYITNQHTITHRFLYKLNEYGAAVQAAVRIENVEQATGALLVLNAHNLPQDQALRVLEYKNGPVVMIGRKRNYTPAPNFAFPVGASEGEFCLQVWGTGSTSGAALQDIEFAGSPFGPPDESETERPASFLDYLVMQPVTPEFYELCAKVINDVSGAVRVSGAPGVNALATQFDDGRLRIVLRNRSSAYSVATVDVGAPIEAIDIKTVFPATQLFPEGSLFQVKVPGRGATVVEVRLK